MNVPCPLIQQVKDRGTESTFIFSIDTYNLKKRYKMEQDEGVQDEGIICE